VIHGERERERERDRERERKRERERERGPLRAYHHSLNTPRMHIFQNAK
jgi:hypothetical protein